MDLAQRGRGEVGVKFDLVDGQDDVGRVHQAAQVLGAEIRDADRARPPVGEERLGRLVGADGVLEVAGHRLIQQIQIDVVEAEPAQAGAKPTCAAS